MQLLVLAGVHFIIDLFASMLPAILPAIRAEFSLSLSLGGLVLAVMLMASNGVQPLIGHMRADKRRPLFLHLGLILAVSICLLGALPRGSGAFSLIILLAVVSGCGIAIVHPEGLRAVHRLKRLPPAVSTAVFMAGGFLGYASGGAVSAYLVSQFGLQGLYPLALCPVIGIILVIFLRVRLAVEPKVQNKSDTRTEGFELTFGGYSTSMFGLGGAIGSFVWANIARKKDEMKCSIAALFLVVPFLMAYLLLINNRRAIWLLFGAGFCAIAAYILMITLSRHAKGLNLGQRMGFMLGGTWALANIVFMALLPAAEMSSLSLHLWAICAPASLAFSLCLSSENLPIQNYPLQSR
jgi:MFS family permease